MHGLVLKKPQARTTGLPVCYRGSVNEPETITVAKAVNRILRGDGVQPAAPLERS